MNHRDNVTAWIVFYDGCQELARLSADESSEEEFNEARGLLAYDYGVHPDEISFRLEVGSVDGLINAREDE